MKNNNIDREVEQKTGSIIINALGWYIFSSFKFFKKIKMGKFKGIGVKMSTFILLACFGICFYTYASPNTLLVNKETLLKLLLPWIYLPFAHLLIDTTNKEKDKEKHNYNDTFINHYSHMGFKEDQEKGISFPYCIGMRREKGTLIYIFKANNNKKAQFEKGIDVLESIVNIPVYEIRKNSNDMSLIEVVFKKKPKTPERLNIFTEIKKSKEDFKVGEIQIDEKTTWNYIKSPHALITGGTGGGKTTFVQYLIRSFLMQDATLYLIDPKRLDLAILDKYFNDVAYDEKPILKLLKRANDEMSKRYDEMRTSKKYKAGADFTHYGYKPVVVFFDEVAAFMDLVEPKIQKIANSYMSQLILKGRQAGFLVVLTTQQANANAIKTAIRDQLGLRVSVGSLSEIGYDMTFGIRNLELKDTTKGAGFIFIDGSGEEIRGFRTPYMPQQYNFISDIENILGEVAIKKAEIQEKTNEIQEKAKEERGKTIKLSDIKNIKTAKEK